MFVTHAPGDPSRLFIAQRGGAIRIFDLDTGSLLATPFHTIPNIATNNEGGLLGLAFHPDYLNVGAPGYGKFYAKYTESGSAFTVRVHEFTVPDPASNVADPSSDEEVLTYTNPDVNHVGGWIGFSPNHDYLYISNGDGGGSNDPGNDAQTTTTNWLGKMLRVDPLGDDFTSDASRNYSIPPTNPFKAGVGSPTDDDGLDEIWAYGLRNPFRASFDRITGDLWIGDVGQGAREEIDFQPANSAGAENYGWRLREGSIPTPGVGGAKPPGNVDPVYDYERPISGGTALENAYRGTTVIGGYVYRGPDPSLQGQYIFLDRSAGSAGINYWRFVFDPGDPESAYESVENIDALLTPNTGAASGPVSMGEDAHGNLYIAYFSGEVYRINTTQLLTGDYNADGEVSDGDFDRWRQLFGRTGTNLAADGNHDGVVNAADYVLIRKFFGASVHALAGGSGENVPEPGIMGIAMIAAFIAAVRRQRSSS
jgi:glucose/arabinose dehydrogenase